MREDVTILELLLEVGHKAVDSRDTYGHTTLDYAKRNGNQAAMDLLSEFTRTKIGSIDNKGILNLPDPEFTHLCRLSAIILPLSCF